MYRCYYKKKIKKVYYAFEDPDIRTYKKAKNILTLQGIKTKLIKTKKYSKFYKSYFIIKNCLFHLLQEKLLYLMIILQLILLTNGSQIKIQEILFIY